MAASVNELAELEAPLLCVLDDYHLLAEPRIRAALQFLLDHQPAAFHLLLLTHEGRLWRWRGCAPAAN